MPTASRLVIALAMAAVAYMASEYYKPLLPEGTKVGLLSEINAVFGLLAGWLSGGRHAGQGGIVPTGIRVTAVMLFYILLGHSLWQMMKLSMRNSYDGPMDAVVGIFDLAFGYGQLIVTSPVVMGILLGGGIGAALLAKIAQGRWK